MVDREGKEEIQRQLLPSLYEALGEDKTLAYLAPALTFRRQTAPAAVFSHWAGRPRAEDVPQYPNSSSQVLTTGSPPSIPQLQMDASRTELASTSTNALQKAFPGSSNIRNFPSKAGIGLVLGLPNDDGYEFSDPTSTGKVTSRPNWFAAHFHNESLAVSSAGPKNEILPDEPTHAWQHDKRSLSAISKLPYRPGPSTSCFTHAEQVTSHMSNSTTANDEQVFAHRDPTQRGAEFDSSCHSCNRIETPEWRRGPGGIRTMCRACRLHYVKVYHSANKYAGV